MVEIFIVFLVIETVYSELCHTNCMVLMNTICFSKQHLSDERLNRSTFETYLIPSVNKYSIPLICNRLASPSAWGTQTELVATANLTGKPVYDVLMNSSQQIQWEPITKTDNLSMPSIIEDDNVPVSHAVCHLEVLYNNTTKHYDSILSKNTGLPYTMQLFIKHSDGFVDLIQMDRI